MRWIAASAITCIGVQAGEITVSWSSNGVLQAIGMEPGSTGVVQAVSTLGETFTNMMVFSSDSNGTAYVSVPMDANGMFFRFKGSPFVEEPEPPLFERMVLIPAGTNSGIDPDFGTYSLTVNSFYMGATEVVKTQWDTVYYWAIMNGYEFDNAGSGKGTNHPVHSVTWYDCVKWCNARSEMEGKPPCYTVGGSTYKTGQSTPDCNLDAGGYRLPTSDEWQYAARGGYSSRRFPWGDTITHSQANYTSLPYMHVDGKYDINYMSGSHPAYAIAPQPYTSPVGDFAANDYGLFDMVGNVSEWCNDWYPGYEGIYRLYLGGAWESNASFCRVGKYTGNYPDAVRSRAGFRVVLPAN